MTQEQIQLIRTSWKAVKPHTAEAGRLFYKKLFAMAPGIRHLFASDIHLQANKLMQVLDYVVEHLDRFDGLIPVIRELGKRHKEYGAKPSHYEYVGICLMETLKEYQQQDWNAELNDAWITAYYRIKQLMIVAQENNTGSVLETETNDYF